MKPNIPSPTLFPTCKLARLEEQKTTAPIHGVWMLSHYPMRAHYTLRRTNPSNFHRDALEVVVLRMTLTALQTNQTTKGT